LSRKEYPQLRIKGTPLSLGQVLLQEAQEEALQAALNTFNLEAVGGGTSRKKYEKELYTTVKKQFEVGNMFR